MPGGRVRRLFDRSSEQSEVSGYDDALGIEVEEVSGTHASGSLEVTGDLLDAAGTLHSGVLNTLAETLASWGAAVYAEEHAQVAMGVSNEVDVFHRAQIGTAVRGSARLLSRSDEQDLWEVTFDGTLGDTSHSLGRASVRIQRMPSRDYLDRA